jgi:hypothetical protein
MWLVRVASRLIEQNHLVDVGGREPAQLAPQRFRRTDQSTGHGPRLGFWVGALPHVVLVPQADRSRLRPLAAGRSVLVAQRELEEGQTVGAATSFLAGFGTHEVADQSDVGIRPVFGELLLTFRERVVVGMDPCAASAHRNWNPRAPMPRRPAISIVPSCEPATHSGGCGRCTGLGSTLRSGILK